MKSNHKKNFCSVATMAVLAGLMMQAPSVHADTTTMSDLRSFSQNYTSAYFAYLALKANGSTVGESPEVQSLKAANAQMMSQIADLQRRLDSLGNDQGPTGPSQQDLQRIENDRRQIEQEMRNIYLIAGRLGLNPSDRPGSDQFRNPNDPNDRWGDRDWDNSPRGRGMMESLINQIRSRLDQAQRDQSLARGQFEDANRRLESLMNQGGRQADQEMQNAGRALETSTRNLQTQNANLQALQNELRNMDSDLAQLNSQLVQQNSTLANAQARLASLPGELAAAQSELANYMQANNLENLQAERQQQNAIYQEAVAKSQAMVKDPTSLGLERSWQVVNDPRYTAVIARRDAAQARMAQIDQEMAGKGQQLAALQAAVQQKTQQLAQGNAPVVQAQQAIANINNAITQKGARRDQLPALIATAQQQVTAAQGAVSSAQAQVNQAQQTKQNFDRQAQPLRQEVQLKQQIVQQKDQDLNNLQRGVQDLQRSMDVVRQLRNEIMQISNHFRNQPPPVNHGAERQNLMAQMQSLQIQIDNNNRRIASLSQGSGASEAFQSAKRWEEYISNLVAQTLIGK